MGMAAATERGGDRANIRSLRTGAHAEITPAVPIVPDETEGMLWGESFADLARQDRTLHGGDDLALEFDQDCLGSKLRDEFTFVAQNRASLLFQSSLGKTVPELEVERI